MSRPRQARRNALAGVLIAALAALPWVGLAGEVQRQLADGTRASARYSHGDPDKISVLLVHDFLDTADSRLSRALFERLERARIGVLAPALALGIGARREPLDCAALHLHHFEQDIRELGDWVDWLLARGRARIVLVGLGYGAWQALALAERSLSPSLQALLMIGPPEPPAVDLDALHAALRGAGGGRGELQRQALWSCPRYVAPPEALLSYARWTGPRLIELLGAAPLAVRIIAAERDRRLGRAWRVRLAESGALMQSVPAADDFLNPAHLEALLEVVVAGLTIEG